MAAAARNASRVLVLLDSDHSALNVAQELEHYCKAFVTVGSYCVVQVRQGRSRGCCQLCCGAEQTRQPQAPSPAWVWAPAAWLRPEHEAHADRAAAAPC